MAGRVSIQAPTRQPTITVAAADSSSRAKRAADFVCDGVDDQVQIQAALDLVSATNGLVQITEGQFTLHSPIEPPANTTLQGTGKGTLLQANTINAQWGIDSGLIVIDEQNVRISDVHLDGRWNQVTTPGDNRSNCVALNQNSDSCYLTRIACRNPTRHGVLVNGRNHAMQDVSVIGSARHAISCGTGALAPGISSHHKLYDVRIADIASAMSAIEINDGSHDIQIAGVFAQGVACVIDIKDHGRPDEGCHSITVTDVVCEDVTISVYRIVSTDSGNHHQFIVMQGCVAKQNISTVLRVTGKTSHVVFSGIAAMFLTRWLSVDPEGGATPRSITVSDSYFIGAPNVNTPTVATNNLVVNDLALINVTIENVINFAMRITTVNGLRAIGCVFVDGSTQDPRGAIDVTGTSQRILFQGCTFGRVQTDADAYAFRLNSPGANSDFLVQGCEFIGLPAIFSGPAPSSSWKLRDNRGYVTENRGTATIASGSTAIVVAHGLNRTPSAKDISVTPTNGLGNAAKFWVTSVGAANFTINVDADPGATTATFAWSAEIKP